MEMYMDPFGLRACMGATVTTLGLSMCMAIFVVKLGPRRCLMNKEDKLGLCMCMEIYVDKIGPCIFKAVELDTIGLHLVGMGQTYIKVEIQLFATFLVMVWGEVDVEKESRADPLRPGLKTLAPP